MLLGLSLLAFTGLLVRRLRLSHASEAGESSRLDTQILDDELITRFDPLYGGPTVDNEMAVVWDENSQWLLKRWSGEEAALKRGEVVPNFQRRFCRASLAEITSLQNRGLPPELLIKRAGQVDDLLGLIDVPTYEQYAQLNFFKISTDRFSRTSAETQIFGLMESPKRAQRWRERPLDPLQLVFFDFFDLVPSANLTAEHAAPQIRAFLSSTANDGDATKRRLWFALHSICRDLAMPHTIRRYNSRPILPTESYAATRELMKKGHSLETLFVQRNLIVQKCRERKTRAFLTSEPLS